MTIALPPDSPLFPTFPNVLSTVPSAAAYRRATSNASTRASIPTRSVHNWHRARVRRASCRPTTCTLNGRDLMSLVDTNAPASNLKPAQRTVAEADARPLPRAGQLPEHLHARQPRAELVPTRFKSEQIARWDAAGARVLYVLAGRGHGQLSVAGGQSKYRRREGARRHRRDLQPDGRVHVADAASAGPAERMVAIGNRCVPQQPAVHNRLGRRSQRRRRTTRPDGRNTGRTDAYRTSTSR